MKAAPAHAAPMRGNRQRQRTRTALLGAGQRLLATRPIEGITIDDIVAEADVAKGSFYNHFNDKDDLVRSIQQLFQGDCEFHIFAANSQVEDSPQRIVRAMCVVLRYGIEHPERLQAMMRVADFETLEDTPLSVGLSTDVRRGIEAGRLRDIDQDTAILVVHGLVNSAVAHVTSPENAFSPVELGTKLGGAMLRGLGVDREEAGAIAAAAAKDILGGKA